MLRILPLVRSYETIDAIGDDFFKHQCYFVTHLIYIFSNYGEHVLNRELFGEEFVFMVSQMFIVCDTLKVCEYFVVKIMYLMWSYLSITLLLISMSV